MNRHKKLLLTLFISTVFLIMSMGNLWAKDKSKLDEILERGHLIIGTSSENVPLGFINKKGELVGFDIDIGKLLAKEIFGDETKVKFVKQSFAARWENVNTGKVDTACMGTTIYPRRAIKVAFTRGLFDSGITLLLREDANINKGDELNSEKYTIANLNVPHQADWAKKFWPKAKVLTFDSVAGQLTAIKVGRATAAQIDVPVAQWYAKEHPDLKVLVGFTTRGVTNNAYFVKRDEFEWWQTLNTIIGEMREGCLYPEYAEIYKKWFGIEPPHQKWYLGK